MRVEEPNEPGVMDTESGLIDIPGICVPDGVTPADRATFPVIPKLFRLIEEVDEPPATNTDGVAGVAVNVKVAWFVVWIITEGDWQPTFPVYVNVKDSCGVG